MLTDLAQSNFWWTAIRRLWSVFDKLIYSIMSFVYQVFLNVASQNILGGGVVKALVGRMQLIVGVVFLFVFAIHIVQGIINPDLFTDKNNGTSKLVVKVIVALCLIAAMIPLNIPSSNSSSNDIISESGDYRWEDALSEQGLLFGTLTFFQNKVLETNVLGKLVLGDNTADYDSLKGVSDGEESTGLSAAGDYMATEILRKFITPNQQPDYIIKESEDGLVPGDSITDNDDHGYVCSGTQEFSNADDGRLGLYQEENDINKLFGYIDNTCTLDEEKAGTNLGDEGMAGDYYMFAYMGGYSTLVGVFVVFVLISFTVEVAVRVFKLLILRIMGPIAAVGYMMPNKSGNMFSLWAKEVAVTFADIFIRLAVIYFSILVVSGLLGEGLTGSIYDASTGVGFVTIIFLIVGLFLFAKQAPKYVKSLFGVADSNGKGLFSGIGTLAGMALGAAGVAGGMVSGALGSASASAQRSEARGENANALRNRFKQAGAGAVGMVTGAFAGARGAIGAENNRQRFSSALENTRQANILKMQRARADSTMRGRVHDRIDTFLGGGETPLERDDRKISNLKAASSNASTLSDYVRNKGIASYGQKKLNFNYKDADGNSHTMAGVSYNELLNARNAAASRGEESFVYKDFLGNKFNIATSGEESDDMFKQMAGTLGSKYGKAQLAKYNDDMKHVGEAGYKKTVDSGFENVYNSAVDNGVYTFGGTSGKGIIETGEEFNSYKLDKVAGAAKGEANRIENSLEHQRHLANNPNGPLKK